jgi:short-chain fatty acids transporter
MIRSLGAALSRWSARWVPDPFVIAILLTLLTLALAWAVTGTDPVAGLGQWGGRIGPGGQLLTGESGLWKLLGFGMQMCLILVTGHALASAPALQRAIAAVADRPTSAAGAIALTATVAMGAGLLNWGLGLVVGALMARDVGRSASRRGVKVHYPLLGAAGYTGMLVWHGGLSGTAPLKVTRASEIKDLLTGVELQPVPLAETLFSPLNLAVTGLLLVCVPLILVAMRPREGDVRGIDAFDPPLASEPAPRPRETPAQRLEHSRVLGWLLAAMALGYLGMLVARTGLGSVDLNVVNLLFLALGLLLHGSPRAYGEAIADGTRSCAGVILQFPFYAGIMGLMAMSGLVDVIAHELASVATATSYGPLTFASAGLVNLFVPSGGGQWAIQGPIVIEASRALAVDPGHAIMAFCYGDEWTNMLQPFWALPLLGITGLKAGDLIGYTGALMLLVAPVYVGCLLLL